MGTSVLLVFLAPLLAIYALFGGLFSEIMPSPKAEIVLPYNESQGLVWEYVEQEDYHINLIEEKIEGDEQIFVFEADQILSFWMKDTPHPLSIAYIDSKGRIRDIFDMTPYSLSSIVSTSSVRYALEVPQGWFKKNNTFALLKN